MYSPLKDRATSSSLERVTLLPVSNNSPSFQSHFFIFLSPLFFICLLVKKVGKREVSLTSQEELEFFFF